MYPFSPKLPSHHPGCHITLNRVYTGPFLMASICPFLDSGNKHFLSSSHVIITLLDTGNTMLSKTNMFSCNLSEMG